MAFRPAKRQKRSSIVSSDGDEQLDERAPLEAYQEGPGASKDEEGANGVLPRSHRLPNRVRSRQISQSSIPIPVEATPASSPKKPKKSKDIPKSKQSQSLYNFFNSATRSQQVCQGTSQTKPGIVVEEEEEDFIQDDLLEEELRQSSNGDREADNAGNFGSQAHVSSLSNGLSSTKEIRLNTRRRFLDADNASQETKAGKERALVKQDDLRPWAERYPPTNLDELAVHKKKVADVRAWLENAFGGRNDKRLLVLKGPAGVGKTATVSILAKALNASISEWKNPVGTVFSSEGFVSASAQFEEFLGRSGQFGSLELCSPTATRETLSQLPPSQERRDSARKAMLVEEFPNTFMRNSSVLNSFRFSIMQHLAARASSLGALSRDQQNPQKITPLILIISETLLTTSTASADSFTAHRLLGREILSHPCVTMIEFNSIAHTILTKALELVIQKEARTSGRRRIPGPTVLKKLGEVGDVRSAIGSLEFLCIRGDDSSDWSGRVASKSQRGAKNGTMATKMEQETMELVTQREASLGIFHAVGKVVYNKRDEPNRPTLQPPDHLHEYARLKVSGVSVDQLIDETGTDTSTFIAALHENYALSCDGPSFMESINGCLDALSDSDLLGPSRGGSIRSRGVGGGFGANNHQGAVSETLRQEEIGFQLAVRGILFALPYPVKRQSLPMSGKSRGTTKGNAFKMFYPTSVQLWKQTEEISDQINLVADSILPSAGNAGPSTMKQWHEPSVESADEDASLSRSSGSNSSYREMVLDRLPYMTMIERHNPYSRLLSQLETITQFHGIDAPDDDAPDDDAGDDTANVTEWATDRPAEPKASASRPAFGLSTGIVEKKAQGFDRIPPIEGEIEKLVLSDDEIEDDWGE